MQHTKQTLRQQVQALRAALPLQYKAQASVAIMQKFMQSAYCRNSTRIGLYYSTADEVNVLLTADQLWQEQKQTFLPICQADHSLLFAPFTAASQLQENNYGILEPVVPTTALVTADTLDVLLLPLVAFDRQGHRLGMGMGYYDKTLQYYQCGVTTKPKLVGLAFAIQELAAIPVTATDIDVEVVYTENE